MHQQFWSVSYKIDVLLCFSLFFTSINRVTARLAFSVTALIALGLFCGAFLSIIMLLLVMLGSSLSFVYRARIQSMHAMFFTALVLVDWHIIELEDKALWSVTMASLWVFYSILVVFIVRDRYIFKISCLLTSLSLSSIPATVHLGQIDLANMLINLFYYVFYLAVALQVFGLLLPSKTNRKKQ